MHTKHYTRPFCISTLQATAKLQVSVKLGGDLKTNNLMFQWSETIG